MKRINMLILALGVASGSTLALANEKDDHAKHHPEESSAKPVTKAAPKLAPKADAKQQNMDAQMKSMQDMHNKMMNAKTPEERHALMGEHMKTMQGGMSMMQGMMGGAKSGKKMMSQQEMQQQMEMMQMMMKMMMDRMGPPAPAK